MKLVNFDREVWFSEIAPAASDEWIVFRVERYIAKVLPTYMPAIRTSQSAEIILPHLLRHWRGKA